MSPEAVKEMPDLDPNLRSAGMLALIIHYYYSLLFYGKVTGVVKDAVYRATTNYYLDNHLGNQLSS